MGLVARASRGYLTGISEKLGRPETDALKIARRAREFIKGVLKGRRHHFTEVQDADLEPALHMSRWGTQLTIESMQEHAVVHSMRHRFQLERKLAGRS